MDSKQKYTAFISYNSKDDKWAKWLQQRLEHYNLPSIIADEKGNVIRSYSRKPEKFKIFRYVSDLVTTTLDEGLRKELDRSQNLIVICSPHSAKSDWCGKEIQYFIDTGRKNKIIPFIVCKTPYSSNSAEEYLHPVLRNNFGKDNILGVNINEVGDDWKIFRKRKAVAKVVTLLIDLPGAETFIWDRYRHRLYRIIALRTLLIAAVIALLLGVWLQGKAFDSSIALSDKTPAPTALPPLKDAEIRMFLDNETKELVLQSAGDKGIFKNIPGRFSGKNVRVTFRAHGFCAIDTVVPLHRKEGVTLNITRDQTYGILSGSIIDEEGNPLGGATIETLGESTQSLADGTFELHIPIAKQQTQPQVTISKSGFHTETYTDQYVSQNWQVMMIKK